MSTPLPLARFLSGAPGDSAAVSPCPVLGALPVSAGEFSGVGYRAPGDYVVRELRGAKMRTVAGIFDEFAAAFQFPYYFGENPDAFDECLRDLDDFLGTAPGYVVVIRDSEQLLADRPDRLEWFAEAMGDAAAHWSSLGRVFRVVLQGTPALDTAPLTL
ncbi:barstar family protein [Nocardia sp. BMG51109]|uniref:barstar family protein n=1 Tax=Nocardia sp. BMG51109 TaxID=1056816 RepID=UPI0004BADC1C|nr:barstar family protein [Nocardia sp. BMG51109]